MGYRGARPAGPAVSVSPCPYGHGMSDALVGGQPVSVLREAFRGMRACRRADGWVSLTGILDPVPGEALLEALRDVEAELPRQIRSTREEHRAAALEVIARRVLADDEREAVGW